MACNGKLRGEEGRIREALALGYSCAALARVYGCSSASIRSIRDGLSYSSTPGRPGPAPASADEEAEGGELESSRPSRVDRAVQHWRKNPDLPMSTLTEMYGISRDALIAARRASEQFAAPSRDTM